MKNQGKFDLVTLRAKADEPDIGGDYYGLPWPCWGTPQIKHPGTHTLYNTNLHAKDGGGTFRARFGVVYEEKQPDGSFLVDAMLEVEEFAEAFGLALPDGEYETLGGYLSSLSGSIPEVGDRFTYDGWQFTVASKQGPRLGRVRMTRLKTPPPASREGPQASTSTS